MRPAPSPGMTQPELDPRHDRSWTKRLRDDAALLASLDGTRFSTITREVIDRGGAARAIVLSGSTVRAARTHLSDIDYLVITDHAYERDGLAPDVDVHVLSTDEAWRKLRQRDDFVQWCLRLGWIVRDDGIIRQLLAFVLEHAIWPDASRKRAQAERALAIAQQLADIGDHRALIQQMRVVLELIARAELLDAGRWPLARAELPSQMASIELDALAGLFGKAVHGEPTLDELTSGILQVEGLLAARQPASASPPS
jgi:hypothetical protein